MIHGQQNYIQNPHVRQHRNALGIKKYFQLVRVFSRVSYIFKSTMLTIALESLGEEMTQSTQSSRVSPYIKFCAMNGKTLLCLEIYEKATRSQLHLHTKFYINFIYLCTI